MVNHQGLVDAVILAGSLNDGPLKECSRASYEALIEIKDRPMVEYVIRALCYSPSINQVVMVGPGELYRNRYETGLFYAPPGDNPVESVMNGIRVLPCDKKILLVTSDIPLLTPEAVEDFIGLCKESDADFYYPVVPRDVSEERYPGVRRTYVKIKEGVFTGGNIFLVNPQIIEPCIQWAEQMVELRKSPLRLCRMLGLGFLCKFFLHTLTLPELETKVSGILGIKARAVITSYPEVGVDVDKPSDLHLVTRILDQLPN